MARHRPSPSQRHVRLKVASAQLKQFSKLGIVLIGRNESSRLKITLPPAKKTGCSIVYVDSSSTDDSCELAHSLKIPVIELSADQPLSAARARNAGFEFLMQNDPDLEYVFFVDGDCSLQENFVHSALIYFAAQPKVVCICGFRLEEHPSKNFFHRITQAEWSRQTGEIPSCGGDALFRTQAFRSAGGFSTQMSAGEEFELCERLRAGGGTIVRLPEIAVYHDCAIATFGQYAKRMQRSGVALALGLKHYQDKTYCKRRIAAAIFHGILVPLGSIFSPLCLLLWAISATRAYLWARRWHDPLTSLAWAMHCIVSKPLETVGLITHFLTRDDAKGQISYR